MPQRCFLSGSVRVFLNASQKEVADSIALRLLLFASLNTAHFEH
jgi:hypothetical protein